MTEAKTQVAQSEDQTEYNPAQEKRQAQAAAIIQKHFGSHPEGVMIVSMTGGRIQCDVSPFPDMGSMCFAKEILIRQFANAFDGSLAQNRNNAEN